MSFDTHSTSEAPGKDETGASIVYPSDSPPDDPAQSSGMQSSSGVTNMTGRTNIQSTEDLRKARENRAMETLKMKDEQLKILTEHNAKLLTSLEKLEEDSNNLHTEKLSIELENRTLRDQNFELQSKSRAVETQSKRISNENHEKDKQIRTLTDQHAELLRLLESEEKLSMTLQNDVAKLRTALEDIQTKYSSLLTSAKSHEELAAKAIKEGKLHVEEIRILRSESEHLKQFNAEFKMKTQIEIEALQEQLRVRKEKQYQLLEKLQSLEELKQQAEDRVSGMDEKIRIGVSKINELEKQFAAEKQLKSNFEELSKQLQSDNNNLLIINKELSTKIELNERERLRMESEARDSADQLRETTEKVFQLLERLKLSELGKTKAMDALKKKEADFISLSKKNSKFIKELAEEGKLRAKVELDNKIFQEQIKNLKKIHNDLIFKSKEDATKFIKLSEDYDVANTKIETLESRLSFLLNKVTNDEETRILSIEERKKLENSVTLLNERANELTIKLQEMNESNRVMANAIRIKHEEYNELHLKYNQTVKDLQSYQDKGDIDGQDDEENHPSEENGPIDQTNGPQTSNITPMDDIQNVRLNNGRGRFYVEAKSMSGGSGSLLFLRGRKQLYKDWLKRYGINEFIKKSQKSMKFREQIIERIGQICGLFMVEQEENESNQNEINRLKEVIELQQKKLDLNQKILSQEESAKQGMLLRYIHAVKEHALYLQNNREIGSDQSNAINEGSNSPQRAAIHGVVLQLSDSNVTDEEVHALASLLKNSTVIDTLNLRGNKITDDGARAIANVLSGKSSLKQVDLRGNKISKTGIRIIIEALERSDRVRHVYDHAGGKIEALGAGGLSNTSLPGSAEALVTSDNGPSTALNVETVCVVDVRDNNPSLASYENSSSTFMNSFDSMNIDSSHQGNNAVSSNQRAQTSNAVNAFRPRDIVTAPSQSASLISKRSKLSTAKLPMKQPPAAMTTSSMLAAATAYTPMTMDDETRKAKLKQIQDELRESSWQGRAGGRDASQHSYLSIPSTADMMIGNIRDIHRNKASRMQNRVSTSHTVSSSFQLPPLGDLEGNGQGMDNHPADMRLKTAPYKSSGHGHSSPQKPAAWDHPQQYDVPRKASIDLVNGDVGMMSPNDASEELVKNVLIRVKKKSGIKSLKTSETEKKLFASPFAQPLIRDNPSASAKPPAP